MILTCPALFIRALSSAYMNKRERRGTTITCLEVGSVNKPYRIKEIIIGHSYYNFTCAHEVALVTLTLAVKLTMFQ